VQFDGPEPAFFQLALDRQAGVGLLDVEDEKECGRRATRPELRRSALAQVVGLEAGEHESGFSGLTAAASSFATPTRPETEIGAIDVNCPVTPLPELRGCGADALRPQSTRPLRRRASP